MRRRSKSGPMTCTEVQRTLVKSAPELWAELSDPVSLARHLGELGEIRITRVQPEREIEWEAPEATGTVQIKSSGWGTRVTLTVNRELERSEPAHSMREAAANEPDKSAVVEPPDTAEPELAEPSAPAANEPDKAAVVEPPHTAEPELAEPSAPAGHEPAELAEPSARAGHEPAELAEASALAGHEPAELADPSAPAGHEPNLGPMTAAAREARGADRGAERDALTSKASYAGTAAEPSSRRGFLARVLERWRGPRALPAVSEPDPFEGLALVSTRGMAWSVASPGALGAPELGTGAQTTGGAARPAVVQTATAAEAAAPAGEPSLPAVEGTAAAAEVVAPAGEPSPGTVEPLPPPIAATPEAAEPSPPAADQALTRQTGLPRQPIERRAAGELHEAEPEMVDAAPTAGVGGEAAARAASEAADGEVHEDDEAVLRSVLDRLGSAHHRPFSRA